MYANLMFVDPCIIVQFMKKNPTRHNNVSKFYSLFLRSSTCFGRHTAHHQEPKIALCLTMSIDHTSNNLPRMKNQKLPVQFRLLMMGSV